MKASFVIPVYNGQAYILEAVDSCLNQTIKDIEVIVVDDGSTDHTNSFVLSRVNKDNRLKLITLKQNVGRSVARNTGIVEAKSDILLMLDADDIATKDRVSLTLKYLKKYPKCSVVSGNFLIMHELGQVLGEANAKPFDWDVMKEKGLSFIGHSTMAFRRNVFDKVQYTDGDYSKHAIDDWKFQVDAYKAGFKFGFIEKNLALYRAIDKERDEGKIIELKSICLN